MTARKQVIQPTTPVTGETVHERFEIQAQNEPDAIAISFCGQQISYGELNVSSNRIGHALHRCGLKADRPVAIMLEDGPTQIAALFGTFKAGAAIVCMESGHPTARLQTILCDTQPTVVITDRACLQRCRDLAEAGALSSSRILLVDGERLHALDLSSSGEILKSDELDPLPTNNPDRDVEPCDPVYMVYTSGSTGKPKGIVQSHRSFCQFIDWQHERFGIRAPQRFAQWASIAYDAGYRQIFGTLCYGATLCMTPSAVRYNPAALVDWLIDERVTILNVVPSFFAELVTELRTRKHRGKMGQPQLEHMLLTGEVFPGDLARAWQSLFDDPPRLWNLYGPSECILATYYEITEVAADRHTMPIGQAIGGREILVLDEEQQPCVEGAAGEIYVRSHYLTTGYFGLPEETARKYLQNPCHNDYPDPVYRTGDLGRVTLDGMLEFLGRKDTQIKLRGMRVELGEIEAALRGIDGVENCAVVVRNDAGKRRNLIAKDRNSRVHVDTVEQQVLVAFYTSDTKISDSNLRDCLAEKLPPHMIPQQFARLDELPVNANRKLDRSALANFDYWQLENTNPYAAPRSTVETQLCDIWAEVLSCDRVGIDDSFFELGGNSLLAMQVLNRIRRSMSVKLTFRDLLESQTIARLAELLPNQIVTNDLKATPITRTTHRSDFPLTLSQQGIWFLWRFEPDSPYYTGQGTLQLEGEFDLALFQHVWRALLERHEILRVRFGCENGVPTQTFDRDARADLTLHDLTNLPDEEKWSTIQQFADEKTTHALDLERDALFQAELFKLSDHNHQVLLTFHEIVLDLWGLSILIRDFASLYQAAVDDDTSSPSPPALSFSEYVLWEHETITRPKLMQQKAYWDDQLAGELPVLKLPSDRPRPATPSYRGASRSVMLDAVESKRLAEFSSENNATLFMTLLAAFNVLLSKYSGQEDIIIGAPLANRSQEGAEDLAGFFLNMLPLRSRLDSDPSFTELLDSVRNTVTGAICNADYPFMWMLEDADVQRDPSVTPVFQVMFNMLNLPQSSAEIRDLEVTYNEIDTPYIKYDLCLYSQEHDDRLYLELAYLTDLFDEESISRMLENFRELLGSIVESPDLPVSRLNMLSKSEKTRLLQEFNDTSRNFHSDLCIHQLFERQVAESPDAIAFVCGSDEIAFAELNARSNQLAHYLRSRGVERESPVAICVERSIDMVVGLLGIMKAGGSYVALDPEYPLLRLEEILADTDPTVLLLQERLDRFDAFSGSKVFIDRDADRIALEQISNPECINGTEDVLNIVYTSSTTGAPKGVMVTGEAVLNRLFWMWKAYPFEPDSVAVFHKSYSLVAATWECFGALLQGVRTVILTHDEAIDPLRFWDRLVNQKVTHLLASPAVYEGVLSQAEAHPGQWRSLRLATTSAEPISPIMVSRWQKNFPNVPLLNLYGSTECSSNVTQYDTRFLPSASQRVPIGTPLANIRVYILDKHMELCPIGAVGEIYVSGACLARGYLNNAELTEQHFLENPFSAESGARIYKTGDLARYQHDGTIELLGRADRQVNIRGFRVELNDVESTLLQLGSVRQCAVVLRRPSSADARLAAYIVGDDDITVQALRAYLLDRLPDYMIPAEYVFLKSLPLTIAGKVDTHALPEPDQSRSSLNVAYVEPSSSTEAALANLWSELLELDMVGVDDDFFDLGGHSLLATRMLFMARDLAGQDLPLRLFFEAPTIAALAKHIDLMRYSATGASNDPDSEEREEILL